MKKIAVLILLSFLLSGCATYKFQKKDNSSDSGYVASYDGKVILEYTVGPENTLPDLALAQERFKRRRSDVEYYYQKMGQIEGRFKEMFWDPPAMIVDFIGGVLRWPFIAIGDYKYNRNPAYKAKVDKLDEENEVLEKTRLDSYKAKLQAYILTDLKQEPASVGRIEVSAPDVSSATEIAPVVNEASPKVETPPVLEPVMPQALVVPITPKEEIVSQPIVTAPVVAKVEPLAILAPEVAAIVPQAQEVKPIVKPVLIPPVAIITARPLQGPSPLTVKFSGQKSYSKSGKIIAYDWDFGDGDTSNKKAPTNTYYSATFGSRKFTVTLTVKDEAGNSSSTSTPIEVLNN